MCGGVAAVVSRGVRCPVRRSGLCTRLTKASFHLPRRMDAPASAYLRGAPGILGSTTSCRAGHGRVWQRSAGQGSARAKPAGIPAGLIRRGSAVPGGRGLRFWVLWKPLMRSSSASRGDERAGSVNVALGDPRHRVSQPRASIPCTAPRVMCTLRHGQHTEGVRDILRRGYAAIRRVRRGVSWGRPCDTTWFHVTGVVPAHWTIPGGDRVGLVADLGFMGCGTRSGSAHAGQSEQ